MKVEYIAVRCGEMHGVVTRTIKNETNEPLGVDEGRWKLKKEESKRIDGWMDVVTVRRKVGK